ncbi:unnamed protein product, partial [Rotaria magnacalcarata]
MDQLLLTRGGTVCDELRTGETISRMSEVIAAQNLPVSLVVTGEDLGEIFSNDFHAH